jgi:hypothetical protein
MEINLDGANALPMRHLFTANKTDLRFAPVCETNFGIKNIIIIASVH